MAVAFDSALNAYQSALDRAHKAAEAGGGKPALEGGAGAAAVGDFSEILKRAGSGVVEDLKRGEAATLTAASGQANIDEVVAAITKAELALQTMTTVRDRALQAYQEIMRMPI